MYKRTSIIQTKPWIISMTGIKGDIRLSVINDTCVVDDQLLGSSDFRLFQFTIWQCKITSEDWDICDCQSDRTVIRSTLNIIATTSVHRINLTTFRWQTRQNVLLESNRIHNICATCQIYLPVYTYTYVHFQFDSILVTVVKVHRNCFQTSNGKYTSSEIALIVNKITIETIWVRFNQRLRNFTR